MLSREIGENEWLSNIVYENDRMSGLVRQLLDLSRAENAEAPMEQLDFSYIVTGEELTFETLAYDPAIMERPCLQFACQSENDDIFNVNSINLPYNDVVGCKGDFYVQT